MYKFNKSKIVLVSSLLMAASASIAQESDITSNMSLTVASGFAVAEVSPLSFGTIRAVQEYISTTGATTPSNNAPPTLVDGGSGTFGAGIRLLGNGVVSKTGLVGTVTPDPTAAGDGGTGGGIESDVTSIVDGTPGEYTITGAAPDTSMRIQVPDAFPLSANGTDAFLVRIGLDDMMVVGGLNDGEVVTATPNVLTDGTGTATFRVGGKLTIDTAMTTAADIPDGTYEGEYTITVSY